MFKKFSPEYKANMKLADEVLSTIKRNAEKNMIGFTYEDNGIFEKGIAKITYKGVAFEVIVSERQLQVYVRDLGLEKLFEFRAGRSSNSKLFKEESREFQIAMGFLWNFQTVVNQLAA